MPNRRQTVLLCVFAIAFALAVGPVLLLLGRVATPFSQQAPVSANPSSTAACFPTWWDANYLYRQRVTVTTDSSAVSSGYSVMADLNHASLVGTGKSQADGDDVRALYWSAGSCGWTELDRALDQGPG